MDPKTQAEWFEWEDAQLLIAPANNLAFTTAALRQFSLNEVEGDALHSRIAFEVIEAQCKLIAKTILLGWKDIQIDEEDIPYTEEKAVELLCHYQALRDQVEHLSTTLEIKRSKAMASTKKKSKTT